MTEHCDTFSDQLRELVRHIPSETPVESSDPVEIRAQRFYQAKLFKSIERQILEYADEIEPKIYARLNLFIVHTTAGPLRLQARDRTHAILSAQELAGPGAKVVRVEQEGEW